MIAEATRLHKAGVPVDDAIKQANFGEYASWTLVEVAGADRDSEGVRRARRKTEIGPAKRDAPYDKFRDAESAATR